jgi:hypothetical protein
MLIAPAPSLQTIKTVPGSGHEISQDKYKLLEQEDRQISS